MNPKAPRRSHRCNHQDYRETLLINTQNDVPQAVANPPPIAQTRLHAVSGSLGKAESVLGRTISRQQEIRSCRHRTRNQWLNRRMTRMVIQLNFLRSIRCCVSLLIAWIVRFGCPD